MGAHGLISRNRQIFQFRWQNLEQRILRLRKINVNWVSLLTVLLVKVKTETFKFVELSVPESRTESPAGMYPSLK